MLQLRHTLRATLPTRLMVATLLAAAGVGMATTAQAADAPARGAAAGEVHTVDVVMPDGAVARVTYRGNVVPRVVLVPTAFANPFAVDPMFVAMERQRVAMLRQMAAMRQAATSQTALSQTGTSQTERAGSAGVVRTGGPSAGPAGTSFHYSFVSTTSGPHGCTRTVEWRSDGSGKEPQVVHAASGDCDAAGGATVSKALTPTGVAPAVAPDAAKVSPKRVAPAPVVAAGPGVTT